MITGTANSLHLFGEPDIVDASGDSLRVRGRKSIALLGYLALSTSQSHSREHLAGLFWPEFSDKDARNNLRVTLARLAKCLSTEIHPVIKADRLSAGFNSVPTLSCDVLEFQSLIKRVEDHNHSDQPVCSECMTALENAISIYTGHFMDGFYLDQCEEFEEWQRNLREQLKLSAGDALLALSITSEHAGDYKSASRFSREHIAIDAFNEHAHRRLMVTLTKAGDRNAAIAHFSTYRQHLLDELGVDPDDATLTVFRSIESGEFEAESIPQVFTNDTQHADKKQHNLPFEKSPYIGNHAALEQLASHLLEHQLVTITGIGGVGKTRLAVQVGRELLPQFPGGVWFTPLALSTTRSEILSNLASVLDVQLLPGDEPIISIANQLDDKKRLLILDNFEHLLDSSDVVRTLIEQTNNLTVLVTSRQQLQLTEEAVFPIAGLSYNPVEVAGDAKANDDACKLFIDVARRARLDFDPTFNSNYIVRIANIVKGHPLALVLAASWVDGLSCQEIAEELQHGLDILESESGDLPDRQRSVRATFNYSWTLLDDQEKEHFSALSVFRGGFNRQAAQKVAGISFPQLARLVRKSLIQHYPEQSRYDMHGLMRQFAEEKLNNSGSSDNVAEAHYDYYLEMLAHTASGVFDAEHKTNQLLFATDFNNIRKACFYALSSMKRNRLVEAIASLRIMCSVSAYSHDLLALLQPALPLIEDPEKDHTQSDLVLQLLLALGFAYRYIKGYFAKELDEIFARTHALVEEMEPSPEVFVVLYGRWSFNFTRGQLRDNMPIIKQWHHYLALLEEKSEHLPYVADAKFVVNMLEGPLLQNMGELRSGRSVMERSLTFEDPTRYAAMMGYYGLNFAVSGRHWLAINQCVSGLIDQSTKTIEQAHDIAQRENNPYLRMFVAFGQLLIYTLRRDVVQIIQHANTVNVLVSEHRIFGAFEHHARVYIAYALNCEDASTGLEQLESLVHSGKGIPLFRLFDAQLLAEALVRSGRPKMAADIIDQYSPPAEEKTILINIAESERIKGDALTAMGELDDAQRCYQRAISIAEKQEAGLYQLRASRAYAKSLMKQNRAPEARVILSAVVDSFVEGQNTADYTEALTLLGLMNNL